MAMKIFSPNPWLIFSSSSLGLLQRKSFLFGRSPIYHFFLLWIMFMVSSLRTLFPTQVSKDFLCLFFKVYRFMFSYKPMLHFEFFYKVWSLGWQFFSFFSSFFFFLAYGCSNCTSTICWKGCPSYIKLLLYLCQNQ